jgi:hypothetical protein
MSARAASTADREAAPASRVAAATLPKDAAGPSAWARTTTALRPTVARVACRATHQGAAARGTGDVGKPRWSVCVFVTKDLPMTPVAPTVLG